MVSSKSIGHNSYSNSFNFFYPNLHHLISFQTIQKFNIFKIQNIQNITKTSYYQTLSPNITFFHFNLSILSSSQKFIQFLFHNFSSSKQQFLSKLLSFFLISLQSNPASIIILSYYIYATKPKNMLDGSHKPRSGC